MQGGINKCTTASDFNALSEEQSQVDRKKKSANVRPLEHSQTT